MSLLTYEEQRRIAYLKEQSKEALKNNNISKGIELYNKAWDLERHATPSSHYDIYSVPLGCSGKKAYIYFLKDIDNQYIKVGLSNNPKNRLSLIQPDCPFTLELIGHFIGDISIEKAILRKFSKHRLRGEWFKYHPLMMSEIEQMLKDGDING